MPDPFDLLRTVIVPAQPDPVFAARLRDRLARALDLPKGVTVSDLNLDDTSANPPAAATPAAVGIRHGDIGYASLWLPDVDRAAAFYSTVLGWRYAPASGHQGRRVEGLALHHGLWGGVDPPTLFCCYAVEDITAATARVTAAGGTAETPTAEPYGIVADCTDDQGVRFALYQPPDGVSSRRSAPQAGGRRGDLVYVTMEVVDSARARAFYGSVLGWRFSGGRVTDGWQVDDVAPMVGMSGGHPTATTVPMYRVDDIAASVEVVRDAGGMATDPEAQPYGITATCTDDQGARFYLGQLPS
jgi:predicted enzyme related to lactoylglutathione lyase